MLKTKSKLLYLILILVIVSIVCYANFETGKVFATDADNEITYVEVSTIEELQQLYSSGERNFDVTSTITITEEVEFDGVTIFCNPARSNNYFNLNSGTLILKNSTIKSNAVWSIDKTSGAPVLTAENEFRPSFLTGKGNLIFMNTTICDIYNNSNKNFITMSGSTEQLSTVDFLNCTIKNCAYNRTFFYGTYTIFNVGSKSADGTLGDKCTVTNMLCRGNGAFLLTLYEGSEINLYSCDVLNNNYYGNGFIAVNFTAVLSLYSGTYSGNSGYSQSGGNWGDLIHLYNNTKFYMYGGEISGNKGVSCIIGTGREDLDLFLYGGLIKDNVGDENNGFVSLSGSITVGEDMVINGDIDSYGSELTNDGEINGSINMTTYNSPSQLLNRGKLSGSVQMEEGDFNNTGTFTGDISIDGNGDVTNSGDMDASITLMDGTLTNDGNLIGSITTQNKKGENDEDIDAIGNITNNGNMNVDLTMNQGTLLNNGTMNGSTQINKGTLQNDGEYNSSTTINNGEFTNNRNSTCNFMINNGTFNNNGTYTGDIGNNGGAINNNTNGTINGNINNENGNITNNNNINADITINNGGLQNNKEIKGNITANGGETINNNIISGNITVNEGAYVRNDGSIYGKVTGQIENNGTIYSMDNINYIEIIAIVAAVICAIIIILIVSILFKRSSIRKL